MTLGWSAPAGPATTLVLLRHGDTRLSPEHRFSGIRDEPLSETGATQAQSAARCLAKGGRIDAVVSSPLQRAARTAAIAAAELGLPVTVDDDLRETDFGEWEGCTLGEIKERWPHEAASWQQDPGQAPPSGESFADTAQRTDRARERILCRHRGQAVLIVSHITPIKTLLCRALDVPLSTLYRMYLGSTCLNEIRWYDDHFAAVCRFNDTGHLAGL
ncbi:MAG: histidine phosphatase family protein [Mycobacteriaceae bacterium]